MSLWLLCRRSLSTSHRREQPASRLRDMFKKLLPESSSNESKELSDQSVQIDTVGPLPHEKISQRLENNEALVDFAEKNTSTVTSGYGSEQGNLFSQTNQVNSSLVTIPQNSLQTSVQKLHSLTERLSEDKIVQEQSHTVHNESSSIVHDRKVNKRLNKMRHELFDYSGGFLGQYDKDVDVILETFSKDTCVSMPSSQVNSLKESTLEIEYSRQSNNRKGSQVPLEAKYTIIMKGSGEPSIGPDYDAMRTFLQSLGVRVSELEFYPDVQEMNKNDILECVERLKEEGIHVVFSLFLIQRMWKEIEEDRKVDVVFNPNSFILRSGLRRVRSLRAVRLYLSLCQLLNKPDLDPRQLLEECAALNIADDLTSIYTKMRMLRSVGASPEDILSNLQMLRMAHNKVKLYEQTYPGKTASFPVELFIIPSMKKFKELLALGEWRNDVAKMLDVSIIEFQSCWGHKKCFSPRQLVHKIQMCLTAGVSKKDVLSNISMLDRFPLEKCHTALESFRQQGLPASVYLLREMERSAGHCTRLSGAREADSELSITTYKKKNGNNLASTKKNSGTNFVQPKRTKTATMSTKKLRHGIFKLIEHHLQLSRETRIKMFKSNINVDSTHVIDVSKNLDFLLSLGFTISELADCPLILAHPYKNLYEALRSAKYQIAASLASSVDSSQWGSTSERCIPPHPQFFHRGSSGPSYSSLPSPVDANSLAKELLYGNTASPSERWADLQLHLQLTSDAVLYLNAVQYLLEKENNFSLVSEGAQLTP